MTRALAERRARWLLRWYPRDWRVRYGEEFTELLLADLAERPHCWQRAADVARRGLLARLAAAGLTAHPLDPATGYRASLATLACSLATFVTVGAAMWSQLTIGWQWAAPGDHATAVAMIVMSGAMLLFAALALATAVPLVWAARRGLRGARSGWLRLVSRPALLALGGALILAVGGRHFGNGWPGTGGHWWPQQGLVPGGIAAFAWACTLWVSSYWAHPGALASFPGAELAWMVISPVAAGCLVTGIAQVLRRTPWPAGARRVQAWLGTAAAGGMTLFLSGAVCWVAEGTPGPHGLFHTGAVDVAGLAVMAAALAIAGRALRQLHRAPGRALAERR